MSTEMTHQVASDHQFPYQNQDHVFHLDPLNLRLAEHIKVYSNQLNHL